MKHLRGAQIVLNPGSGSSARLAVPSLAVSQKLTEDLEWAANFLGESGCAFNERLVGVCGNGWRRDIGHLCAALRIRGWRILVLGGNHPCPEEAIDGIGKMSPNQTTAAMSLCHAIIATDRETVRVTERLRVPMIVSGDATTSGVVEALEALWARRPRVSIGVLAHGQAALVADCFRSILENEVTDGWQLLLGDNGSPDNTVEIAGRIPEVTVLEFGQNLGVARGWNRLIESFTGDPVVLLNSDIVVHPRGIERMCRGLHENVVQTGYIGGLIDSDFMFQRFEEQPDHHFDYVSGSAFALSRRAVTEVGVFDERFGIAYCEDVDYGLRVRQAGLGSDIVPWCVTHLSGRTSANTPGVNPGELCRKNSQLLKVKHGGRERQVTYILPSVGVGGGPRVVFEHLNRLYADGMDVQLFTLTPWRPWIPLKCPVTVCDGDADLLARLRTVGGVKVATWWATASIVLQSCQDGGKGIPAYFVQDIESSYYMDDPQKQREVCATYDPAMRHLTNSLWIAEQLNRHFGIGAAVVRPGINHDMFRVIDKTERRPNRVFIFARTYPLKNWTRLCDALESVEPRPELTLAGTERLDIPTWADYRVSASDEEIAACYNEATVFVQPSIHEGFCLPILEAMACGCPVVTTRCEGNEEFIKDGVNCLTVPWYDAALIARAVQTIIRDPELQGALRQGGLKTAAEFQWEPSISKLATLYKKWEQQ